MVIAWPQPGHSRGRFCKIRARSRAQLREAGRLPSLKRPIALLAAASSCSTVPAGPAVAVTKGAQSGPGRQHAEVPAAMFTGRGEQVDQAGEELQRRQQDLGAAVDCRTAQAVDQEVVVQAAEAAGGQRGAGAVTRETFEAVAVPAWQVDAGVHGPAAGVAPLSHFSPRLL